MRKSVWNWRIVAAGALCFLAVSCTEPDDEAVAGPTPQPAVTGSLPAEAEAAEGETGDVGQSSPEDEVQLDTPLSRFLGFKPGVASTQQQQGELAAKAQDAIAQCMIENGFTYVAWVDDPVATYVPVDPNLDPDSREFAERYGYGVTTQYYDQRDLGPDLVGHSGDGSGVAFTENPNDAIVSSLSEEESLAYQKALWGADSPLFNPELQADAELNGRDIITGGCFGAGQEVLDGEAGEFLDEFSQNIADLNQAAFADPRYVEYIDDVERCVAAEGFEFYRFGPNFWQTLRHFDDLIFALDRQVEGNPFAGLSEEDLAAMTPQEIDALYDARRNIPEPVQDELATLQSLEADVAVAAWDCGANREQEVLTEILNDLEAEFIESNAERLAPFEG